MQRLDDWNDAFGYFAGHYCEGPYVVRGHEFIVWVTGPYGDYEPHGYEEPVVTWIADDGEPFALSA